jgi:hypothetical protein
MSNKNYPVKPDSSKKVTPVRKKEIHEILLELNESADKMNKLLIEYNSRCHDLQARGIKTKFDEHSGDLIKSLLDKMNELPARVEKAIMTGTDNSLKKLDAELSKIKKYSIICSIVINVLFALMVLSILI